jgi:hypothetical protein
METIEFEIVDDSRRTEPRKAPIWEAISAGRTVFIPGVGSRWASGYYTYLKRLGFALHSRAGHDPDGILLWADKIEPAP